MRKELIKWKAEKVSETLIENLGRRGIEGIYIPGKEDVIEVIKKIIPDTATVAVGGSLSLEECGILKFLRDGNYDFKDRDKAKSVEEKNKVLREAFWVDYFLCSANAITMEGDIVQLDAYGTRVAPMLYGPEKVLIVAGMNKIVSDIDSAFERIKNIAPMNAKRLGKNTPCSITGFCNECKSEDRICESYVVVKDSNTRKGRYTVLLVGENLGL